MTEARSQSDALLLYIPGPRQGLSDVSLDSMQYTFHIVRALLRPFGRRYVLLVVSLFSLAAAPAQNGMNHNFEIAKQLDIFNSLYRELDLFYVDTLDPKRNVEDAIAYMLQQLDPYTEFYAKENTEDLKQLSTGAYSGIGSSIMYNKAEQRCVIGQPYEGSPAARVGLMPGDIILSIDGHEVGPCRESETKKINEFVSSVSEKLRGMSGTTFDLKVRRPIHDKVVVHRITRAKVVVPSVSLSTLAADGIGYIHLSQFIEGTASEIKRALVSLKQQGARSLILDLRSNPGGVLEEAVKTVNLFVPAGREVVSMKGRVKEANHTFKTSIDALDPDIPLIVLTDFGSASSAEITAGALQDYDRALIMGERTYGKGLVQQSRELPYKAVLKLTTGHYYIPSGRCVQAYDFKDGEPVHRADSLCKAYRTAAGRVVYDGGGITPDVTVKEDSVSHLLYYLQQSDQLFDYCVEYRARHPEVADPSVFRLSETEYKEFCDYMQEHGFTYDRQSLRFLDALKRVARLEGYDVEAKAEIDALEQKLKRDVASDLLRLEEEVRTVVEAEILEGYYYRAGSERYNLRSDKVVKAAIDLLRRPQEIHKLLTGEPDA